MYKETWGAMKAGKRLIANKGGTRSGKTFGIMQVLLSLANVARPRSIDVVSETFPHLKRGALRDMQELLASAGQADGREYDLNRTDWEYRFRETGTCVRFFAADNWGKVKGSRRDILFINEANRIGWELYRQLAVRTTESIIIDWNPDKQFWYEQQGLNMRETTAEIHSTYKDNKFLTAEQVAEIESYRNDANWWRVYGLGLEGRLEGLVFPEFGQVDGPVGRLLGYGVDFGFSNDQTAVVALYEDGADICLDEVVYATGLITSDLSGLLKDAGLRLRHDVLVCDSARPESIEELYRYGWNAKPCRKGKDSVIAGINAIKRHGLRVTKNSVNLIRELRNYTWECDKEGNPTNKPVDKFNHAIDAARYIVMDRMRPVTFASGTRLVGGYMGTG